MLDFNWADPDYVAVYAERARRLERLRENPQKLPALHAFYRDNPIQFIQDWGMTYDPRNVGTDIPSTLPFILFERQIEWCEWVLNKWENKERGDSPKSRDVGLTWLAVNLALSLALFHEGISIGFGSRKEEYVDKLDDPKSIFWKLRWLSERIPKEFRRGFNLKKHAPYMRLILSGTSASITGEAGDNIGRGDRKSIYFVDESAHLEHPELNEASLSATTDCRIDISSVNGTANPFAQRVLAAKNNPFIFHWRQDPRKNDEWYAKQCANLDPVTVAQEIDINFSASITGQIIPPAWVQAAIGALEKLGLTPSGVRRVGFDVADEGIDLNATCSRYGQEIRTIEAWSGKDSDIYQSTLKAMATCGDDMELRYDADGLGAGVKGDSRRINEDRRKDGRKEIDVTPFRGSGEVVDPDKDNIVKDRKNKDYFANAKAQGWWNLRILFQNTYRAVVQGQEIDPDLIISIHPDCSDLNTLTMQLSQPTYTLNSAGKILVNKAPNGTRSPNHADSVMIAFAPAQKVSRGFFSDL